MAALRGSHNSLTAACDGPQQDHDNIATIFGPWSDIYSALRCFAAIFWPQYHPAIACHDVLLRLRYSLMCRFATSSLARSRSPWKSTTPMASPAAPPTCSCQHQTDRRTHFVPETRELAHQQRFPDGRGGDCSLKQLDDVLRSFLMPARRASVSRQSCKRR